MNLQYPIYIPSKNRMENCYTARFLLRDKIPFRLVVEPQEYNQYKRRFGKDHVLELPFSNQGSVIPARNWIKQHSIDEGHVRHWQLDDNIRRIRRWYKGKRIPCQADVAFRVLEDFVDRYENIAIAGMNYNMFGIGPLDPFILNCRVYSCALVLNSIPHLWRGKYNEDTDICLQVLADGWCTVLLNVFLIEKIQTMLIKGGNTTEIYRADGRLKMARSLERLWPGVVSTHRRFQRPQHHVYDSWKRFDTPLKLKPGINLENMKVNEYGMKVNLKRGKIRGEKIQKLMDTFNKKPK